MGGLRTHATNFHLFHGGRPVGWRAVAQRLYSKDAILMQAAASNTALLPGRSRGRAHGVLHDALCTGGLREARTDAAREAPRAELAMVVPR